MNFVNRCFTFVHLKPILGASLIFLLLCGCSVMKRRYQKGLYVSVHGKNTARNSRHPAAASKVVSPSPEIAYAGAARDIQAAAGRSSSEILHITAKAPTRRDLRCDTLYMRNGEVRVVKVTEITPDLISYSRCDQTEGPKYSVRKQDVARIVFSNGVSEIIAAPPPAPAMVREQPLPRRKYHPAAIAALGAALLSLFVTLPDFTGLFCVLLIGATLLAIISLNAMLAHPHTYRGKALAIITLVYCFLFGLLLIAFLTV